ncbi:LAGLIDADG family homing endonuclease [Bacillus sp. EB01]|uniref:LAGLIDADG family homing endonuclease n=1 Tax=Bacillus sp. EB01 TaxID=1347086 RepID=UPI000693A158|nr:LAGLIDADG family homing endonuclease [Bacillus sp. EB01]
MSKEERNIEIASLYGLGMKTSEIAKKFGLSDRGVTFILNKLGVKMRSHGYRKYKLNEDFFKEWSNEMAWVLGFVVTDGCVDPNNQSVSISQKDLSPLEKIKDLMNFTGPITKSKNQELFLLIINSKTIKEDLKELGVTARKSLTVKFPACPPVFLPHFVRGVIDGDGHVDNEGYAVTVTSASISFAQGLLAVFQSWGMHSKIHVVSSEKKNPIYRIIVSGRQSVKRLSEIIYQDCDDNCVFSKKDKMINPDNNSETTMRVKFRTTISSEVLERLNIVAKENKTYINYLLETGIKQILDNPGILVTTNKHNDRILFKTSYNRDLLDKAKAYAKTHSINMNDLLEQAADLIKIEEALKEGNRHRT